MSRPIPLLICALLILGLLASCAPAASRAAPTAFAPSAGNGGITGEIRHLPQRWASEELFIYAAPYAGDETQGGVYFLEPALHPHAPLDGGAFQLDIPRGEYVLVVGPSAEEALLVVDDQGRPLRIIVANAGQIIELGQAALSTP